ncbi:MAG TPA: hypothetical protein VF257_18285 [Solirubrobacteraceae bacterium]
MVRWLPVIGVALGIAVGAVVWLVVGADVLFLREAVLALGGVLGLVAGLMERTRVGRMLLADPNVEVPPDLPAEFHHVVRGFDHREDAMARRDRF